MYGRPKRQGTRVSMYLKMLACFATENKCPCNKLTSPATTLMGVGKDGVCQGGENLRQLYYDDCGVNIQWLKRTY